MSFVTHAPGRAPSAAIASGARPAQADGPGWSIGPKTGDYVIWDARLLHGSRPQTPADPYRPRTRGHVRRESRRVGRQRRRTGGIPEAVRWCLRAFGTGSFVGDGASSPLPHRVARLRCLPFLGRHMKGNAKYFYWSPAVIPISRRREPLPDARDRAPWRKGKGLRCQPAAPEGADALHSNRGVLSDCRPRLRARRCS